MTQQRHVKKIILMCLVTCLALNSQVISDEPKPGPSIIFDPCKNVGYVPGEFKVTPQGAATYNIPIEVPPGSAGMEPNISLHYNSQQGNGSLGVGWQIAGLSTISRCPADLVRDGFKGSINYDTDDRFCLDGKRLVAINGEYGADGTEYRTDPDTFSKIISYGNDGYGPIYFKVWTKDGRIIEYGGNLSSGEGRIERYVFDAQTAEYSLEGVRIWAVSKMSDHTQKYMEFDYEEDNDRPAASAEYWIKEIRYTGHTLQAPYNTIEFVYDETRQDNEFRFEAGSKIELTRRLNRIKTFADAQQVLDYRLGYDDATLRSHLLEVKLCDGSNNCFEPTTFEWREDDIPQIEWNPDSLVLDSPDASHFFTLGGLETTVSQTIFSGNIGSTSVQVDHFIYGENKHLGADFNNDGRGDVYLIYQKTESVAVDVLEYDQKTEKFIVKVTSTLPESWDVEYNRYMNLDATGDGKTDIVVLAYDESANKSYAKLYKATDSGFTFESSSEIFDGVHGNINDTYVNFVPANLNGDFQQDLIGFTFEDGTGYRCREAYAFKVVNILGTYSFESYPLNMQADPDKPNLMKCFTSSFPRQGIKDLVADVNGDGLSDILYVEPIGQKINIDVFLSTPQKSSKFTKTTEDAIEVFRANGSNFLANNYIFSMDVNGDGNDDLAIVGKVGLDKAVLTSYVSNGLGDHFGAIAFSQQDISGWDENFYSYYPGDFNGDGKTDLAFFDRNEPDVHVDLWLSEGKEYASRKVFRKVQNGAPLGAGNINALYLFQDFNGDAKSDIARIDGNRNGVSFDFVSYTTDEYYFSYMQNLEVDEVLVQALPALGNVPDLMERISVQKSGWKNTIAINYQTLAEGSTYLDHTSLAGHDHFTRDYQNARYVVESYSKPDGIGGDNRIIHRYKGSKLHAAYGSLGFEEDGYLNIKPFRQYERDYYQAFPLTGKLKSYQEKVKTNNVYFIQNEYTWDSEDLGNRFLIK